MSLVLYSDINRKCTVTDMTNKLAQLRDAIARHDHATIITLSKSFSRRQAAHMALKYQAYFGEFFFMAPGFRHRSFGSLSIYGPSSINGVSVIYETLAHEEGEGGEAPIPSSCYYGELIKGYFTEPYKYDAECLYSSLYHSNGVTVSAKATDESSTLPDFLEVIELLCTRTDDDILGMRRAYNLLTGGLDMFTDVLSFLTRQSALYQLVSVGLYSLSYRNAYNLDSMDATMMMESELNIAQHPHLPFGSNDSVAATTPSTRFYVPIDISVEELLEASNGFAHREAIFYEILFLSSSTQLQAIAAEYKVRTGVDLDTVLTNEFTGIISYALRLRYYFVINPARCYALILYTTIKEYRDRSFLRTLLISFDNMYAVAQEFYKISKKHLRNELSRLSTGNFKRLALALFDSNHHRNRILS